MKKILSFAAVGAAFALPAVSFAAYQVTDVSSVGSSIINIINGVIVPVLFAIAFIVFLWGAFDAFILGASRGGEVKEKGKSLMLWGLIGFFVMVSVWGLVNLLSGTFQFGNNTGPSSGLPTTQQVGY